MLFNNLCITIIFRHTDGPNSNMNTLKQPSKTFYEKNGKNYIG